MRKTRSPERETMEQNHPPSTIRPPERAVMTQKIEKNHHRKPKLTRMMGNRYRGTNTVTSQSPRGPTPAAPRPQTPHQKIKRTAADFQ